MIPKKIHYCWFGGNPLPEDVKKYIETWKKYCPDYEIIEWNESTFDVTSNTYVYEAFQSKKWAFITDYVRLYALYHHGGLYMDTDVEVLKNLDSFLIHPAFSGFEKKDMIPTALMGSEKGGKWVGMLLSYYNDRHFILEDGSLDLTTNVITITNMTKAHYDIILNNTYQELDNEVVFYPNDYFCPKSYDTGIIKLTDRTHVIHHFSGTWKTDKEKKVLDADYAIVKKYGDFGKKIVKVRQTYRWYLNEMKKLGFKGTIKRFLTKILK